VGHRGLGVEGRLAAALFYAGPGAALSHLTAGWWWQLLPNPPTVIHISATRRLLSRPGMQLHLPRRLERTWCRRLPVTPVARTLLDIAAVLPFDQLRRAMAEAEYRRMIDLDSIPAVLKRGRPGSAALKAALERHRPELARTLSVLEERFLALCETHGIRLPEVNAEVAGMMVDALWVAERVIVELDGQAAHGTFPAVEKDRGRELALRAVGYQVLRYTWQQVTAQPELVVGDLRAALLQAR
jgi:very-short-patch-repair endonuclease